MLDWEAEHWVEPTLTLDLDWEHWAESRLDWDSEGVGPWAEPSLVLEGEGDLG